MGWVVLTIFVLWILVFGILWCVAAASGQAGHDWEHRHLRDR